MVPYDDVLKVNDFITYKIYDEMVSDFSEENHKIVYLNDTQTDLIVKVENKKTLKV
ncbi:hypothetical protein [Bacillus sp. EAC]|uniref:hypothetical protein n=1 Tax=Bacillus sp. EAC TaxID=1978338 RepID=UPI001C4FC210|nr:hypothetical protein [Bacillus sp. EAC]